MLSFSLCRPPSGRRCPRKGSALGASGIVAILGTCVWIACLWGKISGGGTGLGARTYVEGPKEEESQQTDCSWKYRDLLGVQERNRVEGMNILKRRHCSDLGFCVSS